VHAVENRYPETILLAMAGLELDAGRRLADAVEAAERTRPPVTGQQLVDAGVAPGPWIGRALRRVRDAMVDGEIDDSAALALAVDVAQEYEEAAS
jgi:hypothetical protein